MSQQPCNRGLANRPSTAFQSLPRAGQPVHHRAPPHHIPGALPKACLMKSRPITVVSAPQLGSMKRKRDEEGHPSEHPAPRLPPRPPAHVPVPSAQTRTPASKTAFPPVDGGKEWWLARSLSLPEERRNGWVMSCIIDRRRRSLPPARRPRSRFL